MVARVPLPEGRVAWARRRSGLSSDQLLSRFPRLGSWEDGTVAPTLKQLDEFARATYTPIGYFFLPAPPEEPLPVPDFRTVADQPVGVPSVNLLDTIFECQRRQDWYREHVLNEGQLAVAVVGALDSRVPTVEAASQMRHELRFETRDRGPSWAEAFRRLADHAEESGVLVMVNGVVGSNTHRKLDPREFRGFALVDAWAPLVFVNGADTKAAQIFTLAHELVHIWRAESGLDDGRLVADASAEVERWCNAVAAEFLVPAAELADVHRGRQLDAEELDRLAAIFRTSTLVVLRRIFDTTDLEWTAFRVMYESEEARLRGFTAGDGSTGGNFYNTQPVRTSKMFTRSLITSVMEGQTLYRDAFQMLGFRKQATFDELARRLGVA